MVDVHQVLVSRSRGDISLRGLPRWLCLLVALVAGCGDTPTNRRDGSVDASTDASDGSARICAADLLGVPCRKENECGANGICLRDVSAEVGVCVCPCTPDDLETPVNEDDCPRSGRNVCGTIVTAPGETPRHFCFERCSPELGFNQCRAPLACRPESIRLTGTGQAVCSGVGCTADQDCPVWTDRPCDTSGEGDPCPKGQRCVAELEGTQQGRCVTAGRCDEISGICAPRDDEALFDPDAEVGDPCDSDIDCDAQMVCLREVDEAALLGQEGEDCEGDAQCCSRQCVEQKCAPGACALRVRNGYCTVRACGFSKLPEYACPDGSSCNQFYPPGICQRDCVLTDPTTCRGVQADRRGDYECRAWNQITANDQPLAPRPVCDLGDRVSCDRFSDAGLTCANFGLTANPTLMSCRSLDGIETDDPFDPEGFCLDVTSSGIPR